MSEVKRTERGWPGHFILSSKCSFRRNTLLEYGDIRIVVSTVGNLVMERDGKLYLETVGLGRYFETMAFMAMFDGTYWDADVRQEVHFDSNWKLNNKDTGADNQANDMHETVVNEISEKLKSGKLIVEHR